MVSFFLVSFFFFCIFFLMCFMFAIHKPPPAYRFNSLLMQIMQYSRYMWLGCVLVCAVNVDWLKAEHSRRRRSAGNANKSTGGSGSHSSAGKATTSSGSPHSTTAGLKAPSGSGKTPSSSSSTANAAGGRKSSSTKLFASPTALSASGTNKHHNHSTGSITYSPIMTRRKSLSLGSHLLLRKRSLN